MGRPLFVRGTLMTRFFFFLLIGVGIGLWPLKWGGSAVLVVLQSDSMRPHFRRGDLVLVRRAPYYQMGDIVLYKGKQISYIFHRIVAYDEQGRFRTQGDANTYLDPDPVEHEDIMGKYVFHIPRLGWFFLRWGRAFGWLLFGLALLMALWSEDVPARRRNHRLPG